MPSSALQRGVSGGDQSVLPLRKAAQWHPGQRADGMIGILDCRAQANIRRDHFDVVSYERGRPFEPLVRTA